MRLNLKKRWLVPVATLALTLSIGSAAFAATESSTTASGATSTNPWGTQRTDETLLTGDTLAQVQAVVTAQVGSATIVRIETDSDASQSGHATYEAHIVKADGTAETVYVDSTFTYVSIETQPAGEHGAAPSSAAAASSSDSASSSTATSSN